MHRESSSTSEPTISASSTDRTVAALTEVAGDATARALEAPGLAPGVKIGRYVVLERLAAGGMGVVYSAYDPELDRKIVLKLLHPGLAGTSAASTSGRARLLREAQAMAKLSHPNVVAVHDVGTFGDEVFIAMEFIDGVTLSQWLRAGPRALPEVLRVFRDAGRGLAAAHRAGLVHRDFKPDNVMIAGDGQVRVMDFGLARGANADSGDADARIGGVDSGLEISVRSQLTTAGTIIGTPSYMAPEQFALRPIDARTDQFSFCVALYEALYGERPFEGDTVAELARSVTEGEIKAAPRGSRAPAPLRRALLRGLASRPDSRYSSMDTLLAELSVDSRIRRFVLAGAALALVGVIAGLLALGRAPGTRTGLCAGGPAQWGDVWDDARRAEVRARLFATGRANAASSFDRAAAVLDTYATSWIAGHAEACEATHVRGEQSDELLDLRMRCLARRREAARATVDLLAAADVGVLDRAVDLVHALPPIAGCADIESLVGRSQAGGDPAMLARIDGVRARLSAAEANDEAGRSSEGLVIAREAVAEAQALGQAQLVAESTLIAGRLLAHAGEPQEAEASLLAAVDAAVAGHDGATELAAWTELVRVVGGVAARHAEGLMLSRIAAMCLRRAGSSPVGEAELATALSRVYEGQGRFADARVQLEHALSLYAASLPADHPKLGRIRVALGDVAREQGDLAAARASYAEAGRILVAALGPDHPDVAAVHNSTGNVRFREGDFDAARAEYEAALAIRERVLGPQHPDVAATLNNMGGAYEKLGELARALELHQRSLQIRRAVFGERHPKVAMSLANLGNVLTAMGRVDEGIRRHREALAIREEALGPEHPSTGESLGSLSSALVVEDRDLPTALEYSLRSRVAFEKALGPHHPNVISAHLNIGTILSRLGRPAEAREAYARALAAIDASGGDSPLRWPVQARLVLATFDAGERAAAQAMLEASLSACESSAERDTCLPSLHFARARLLWARGDRAAARALAEGALPKISSFERLELTQWLEKAVPRRR